MDRVIITYQCILLRLYYLDRHDQLCQEGVLQVLLNPHHDPHHGSHPGPALAQHDVVSDEKLKVNTIKAEEHNNCISYPPSTPGHHPTSEEDSLLNFLDRIHCSLICRKL